MATLLKRIIPREYVDRLLAYKTEEFHFGASVKTERGDVHADSGELKGQRLVFVGNDLFKDLSVAYTRLLNRLARIKGINARFKAYIVPTDAEETIKTPYGEAKVIFVVVEVYRETVSSRKKVFQYGTVLDDGHIAYFNPFGVVNDEGIEFSTLILTERGMRRIFPTASNRPPAREVTQFAVLKLLNGREWGAYFNFPMAFVRYKGGQYASGYAYVRLDGNRAVLNVFTSGVETLYPAFNVKAVKYSNEVEENRTPDGLRVRHFPTLTAGGQIQIARFFVSKKNPDVVWLGKLAGEMFSAGEPGVKVVEEPMFLIGTEKELLNAVTEQIFEKNGKLYVSEIPRDRGGYSGRTYFTVKGYNPFRDHIGVVNARVPGIGLYAGRDFNVGVLFHSESDDGMWGTAKGIAVITSKDGRLFMKKVKVEGQKYAY